VQEQQTLEVLKMPRVKKNSYDQYNCPFATRLRLLMDSPGMNQQKLADFIGVTRQAVSAYSLGISLPDIDKFEKIADFFDVSTEYLLGRTEVMKADMEKQAISDVLQLSEKAIDKIYGLQKDFRLEQNIENNRKLSVKEKEPIAEMFSDWLEFVDLDELMSNLYNTVKSAADAQNSGYYPERYMLDEESKTAIYDLKQQGYVTLFPTEQMDLYEQKAAKVFIQSVESLQSEAINTVIEVCKEEKSTLNQPKNDETTGGM